MCALLDKHGLVAAYVFLGWKRAVIPEIECEIPLKDDEVYCMGMFILPEHRGQKLFSYLLTQAVARAQRLGSRTAVTAANPENLPSTRVLLGSGWIPYRDAYFRKIARWRSLRWVSLEDPEQTRVSTRE
jgi:GNAT superfamily N-acetyltransferase